jgi:hypothetical protein
MEGVDIKRELLTLRMALFLLGLMIMIQPIEKTIIGECVASRCVGILEYLGFVECHDDDVRV